MSKNLHKLVLVETGNGEKKFLQGNTIGGGEMATLNDRLDSFRIYKLACQLFDDFWNDSETMGKDYRGRELVKQQVRSLDSICANIEEGYGRGFGKELPQHLRIARGEARESRGRYKRLRYLLSIEIIAKRLATLDHIIGGLTNTVDTITNKRGNE
ncbi:MAG: four helix bundle protein [Planctomycetes bacterium]|nr:four helix bundle protein [Planctomycetota bacterium]